MKAALKYVHIGIQKVVEEEAGKLAAYQTESVQNAYSPLSTLTSSNAKYYLSYK